MAKDNIIKELMKTVVSKRLEVFADVGGCSVQAGLL